MPQVIEVPGYGDVEFPDDMSDAQISAAIRANMLQPSQPQADPMAKYEGMSLWDKAKNDASTAGKAITPIIRGAYNAITAIPGLAADAGVSIRNLVTGSNYEAPTASAQRSIDKYLPLPGVPGDKTLEMGVSLLGGTRLPAPQVANPAPANFVKPAQDLVRQNTLAGSKSAGYVVPPATTNPSLGNRVMESIGGKIATAQDAAAKNQNVTNTLAKRAVGLSEDAPLTAESLSALRKEAGDAYAALRKVGQVSLDEQSTKALDAVASKFSGSKLKEALGGGNEIPKIVQAIKDEPLTGDTAVDAIDLLRNSASKAYASGDKGLGKAYKSLSETIENLMERNLSGDALKSFKDARQLIAKTYSIEGALNPSTGNVAATKLASQLSKGKPLSGDLLTAAKFGQAFPRAAQSINDSGAVRNTDVIMGAGTSAVSGQPGWLLYPFARQGMRNFLLSPGGQSLAFPQAPRAMPPQGLLGAMTLEESLRK